MKKVSDEAIHKALKYAKASVEFEGFSVTKEMEEVILSKVKGRLSESDFAKRAREIAKQECQSNYDQDYKPLINLADLQKQEQLDRFEAIYTTRRILELSLLPIKGRFDLQHLCQIHQYIFQDIYPFAGKIRNVNIAKGNTLFAHAQFIEEEGKRIFSELRANHYLRGLEPSIFIEKMAYYLAEINILHPFREGNGRAQREFVRVLGLQAGHEIDWSKTNREHLIRASIQSVHDLTELKTVLETVVSM